MLQSEGVKETTGRCRLQHRRAEAMEGRRSLPPIWDDSHALWKQSGVCRYVEEHTHGDSVHTPPTVQTPGKRVRTRPGSVALAAVGLVPKTPNLNRNLVSVPWTVPPNTQTG